MRCIAFCFLLYILAQASFASTDYSVASVQSENDNSLFACDSLQNSITNSLSGLPSGTVVNGAVIGLYSNGNICYFNIGYANVAAQTVPDKNTIFAIGSVTKTFTTTILGLWQNKGLTTFNVNAPIDLSNLNENNPAIRFPEGYHPSYLQLATFTAGFPDIPPNLGKVTVKNYPQIYQNYTETDFIDAVNALQKPSNWPAVSNVYSDMSLGLLGQVLMSLESTPLINFDTPNDFDTWINQYITQPLGMQCTSADPSTIQTNCPNSNYAVGYYPNGSPVGFKASCSGLCPRPWIPYGMAGSLWSTPADMMLYIQANLQLPKLYNGIIPPLDLLNAMKTAQTPAISPVTGKLIPVQDINGDTDYDQAYAWMVRPATATQGTRILKNGAVTGFSSCVILAPKIKTGLLALYNTEMLTTGTQCKPLQNLLDDNLHEIKNTEIILAANSKSTVTLTSPTSNTNYGTLSTASNKQAIAMPQGDATSSYPLLLSSNQNACEILVSLENGASVWQKQVPDGDNTNSCDAISFSTDASGFTTVNIAANF